MLNKIIVHGRITRDVELRNTTSGKSVCSFSVAVDRDRHGQDGTKETDFISVVGWGKTAEFISKYFGKGSEILISGRLQTRSWEDDTGNNHRAVEIVAENADFCGPKKTSSEVHEIEEDEDIPF